MLDLGNPTAETDSMAEVAVLSKPLSRAEFPVGICREFLPISAVVGDSNKKSAGKFKGLQKNSLRSGAGNLCRLNRELLSENREFAESFRRPVGTGQRFPVGLRPFLILGR
jgi:hypothetical protein